MPLISEVECQQHLGVGPLNQKTKQIEEEEERDDEQRYILKCNELQMATINKQLPLGYRFEEAEVIQRYGKKKKTSKKAAKFIKKTNN